MKILIVTGMIVSLILTVPCLADDHHHTHSADHKDHDHSEASDLKSSIDQLKSKIEQLKLDLAKSDSAAIHNSSEQVSHLASHIAEDAGYKNKNKLQGYAINIYQLSGIIHELSDYKDFKTANAKLTKLDAMMKILEKESAN